MASAQSSAGSRAPALLGRRVVALVVDWAAATVVSRAFFDADPWATLAVFTAEQLLLVATVGGGFGHVLLGLRVRRLLPDGETPAAAAAAGAPGSPGLQAAAVRALLLALAVPPLLVGADGRGLHDRAAGTVLVRR